MALELLANRRKIVAGKSGLRPWLGGDCLSFSPRVLCRILRKQRRHGCGVTPHFLHRTGKPFINRAVHQYISEEEHADDGKERKQKTAHYQARAEFRSQNAE